MLVFFFVDEFFFCHVGQVAVLGADHDWDVA